MVPPLPHVPYISAKKMVFDNPSVIVAGSLVLGSLPLFLGLIIVVPVLGHATWHLYRKLVV